MDSKKKDFYGKEIADAIKEACDVLGVPQERLEIEVVETGSTGIFGLIRKKAHIRALVKVEEGGEEKSVFASAIKAATPKKGRGRKGKTVDEPVRQEDLQESAPAKPKVPAEAAPPVAAPPAQAAPVSAEDEDDEAEVDEEVTEEDEQQVQLPEEALELVKTELCCLLTTMGYDSPVTVTAKGTLVNCHVGEEHQDVLVGQDGKTLDSLQYLLRKIVARKVPHKLRLVVDIGNFREQRLEELKTRALDLAEKVKASGKTQIIPALSPSERRVIHMSLQDDKEIRSRSVGDGLFKKILIYLPGKGGGRNGGRRRSSRGKKATPDRNKAE